MQAFLCHHSNMNTTAKDLQDFCIVQMTALCSTPNRTDSSVYGELAEYSGMGKSYIRQFHIGERPNLTTDSLDRLVGAVKSAMRRAAA
jgi:hypothetical protein